MLTATYAANYNYDPSVYYLFIDASPLLIGGDNNYVLICLSTDLLNRESYFQKSLHIGLPDDEDGGHGALRGREEQGWLNEELGLLRSEPLQGVFGLQVTCLKAWSSLAGTRLISSVEEVEEALPYSPATWNNLS